MRSFQNISMRNKSLINDYINRNGDQIENNIPNNIPVSLVNEAAWIAPMKQTRRTSPILTFIFTDVRFAGPKVN